MRKTRNPLTLWATWLFSVVFILLLIAFMVALSSCSFPFLQAINPTFTVQIQTSQGPVDIQIPAELPDFVTGKRFRGYTVGRNICMLSFQGVTLDSQGRYIDHYDFIVKCDKTRVIGLRATTMDTERFWIYIEGIPIPASHDQLKEKIEGLIGKKI